MSVFSWLILAVFAFVSLPKPTTAGYYVLYCYLLLSLVYGGRVLENTDVTMIRWPDGTDHNITTFRMPENVTIPDPRVPRWKFVGFHEPEYPILVGLVPRRLFFITSIIRSENVYLWNLYRTELTNMTRNGPTNERMLWFATPDGYNNGRLLSDGFNSSAPYATGALGAGLHFYTNLEDAVRQLDMRGYTWSYVLLVRVALGASCEAARPNCDSVRSTDGQVYAVRRAEQTYPNYKFALLPRPPGV